MAATAAIAAMLMALVLCAAQGADAVDMRALRKTVDSHMKKAHSLFDDAFDGVSGGRGEEKAGREKTRGRSGMKGGEGRARRRMCVTAAEGDARQGGVISST